METTRRGTLKGIMSAVGLFTLPTFAEHKDIPKPIRFDQTKFFWGANNELNAVVPPFSQHFYLVLAINCGLSKIDESGESISNMRKDKFTVILPHKLHSLFKDTEEERMFRSFFDMPKMRFVKGDGDCLILDVPDRTGQYESCVVKIKLEGAVA